MASQEVGIFLSRSRGEFFAENLKVIVVYRASDLKRLDYGYRVSKDHVGELAKVIAYAKQNFGKPVWLVGTSRGTVSGTATAIALGDAEVQGLVLTSSVTSKMTGAIGLHVVSCGKPRPQLGAACANGLAGRCSSLDMRR